MNADQGSPSDQWVTIPEAARRLGLSMVTVRRRIKMGTLEAELQPGIRGPEYRVRLPSETIVDQPQGTQATSELIRLAEHYRTDVAGIMAELREARDRSETHAVDAAGWKVRAELLEAEVERLRAELERARRPWWRRWLG